MIGFTLLLGGLGKLRPDPDRLGARLTLGGVWPDPDVEVRTKSLAGWSNVDFVGWVDRKDVGSVFAQSRCGLILYEPTPNVIESEPNKFFECMSAGLPIIVSNFPIWRQLIEQIGCGICVDPGDYQAIADAITWIMDLCHRKLRSLSRYAKRFSKKHT